MKGKLQGQLSVGYKRHIHVYLLKISILKISTLYRPEKASECVKLLDDHQRHICGSHLIFQNELIVMITYPVNFRTLPIIAFDLEV